MRHLFKSGMHFILYQITKRSGQRSFLLNSRQIRNQVYDGNWGIETWLHFFSSGYLISTRWILIDIHITQNYIDIRCQGSNYRISYSDSFPDALIDAKARLDGFLADFSLSSEVPALHQLVEYLFNSGFYQSEWGGEERFKLDYENCTFNDRKLVTLRRNQTAIKVSVHYDKLDPKVELPDGLHDESQPSALTFLFKAGDSLALLETVIRAASLYDYAPKMMPMTELKMIPLY